MASHHTMSREQFITEHFGYASQSASVLEAFNQVDQAEVTTILQSIVKQGLSQRIIEQ